MSYQRRSNGVIYHRSSKCDWCGDTNLADASIATEQIIDVKEMSKAKVAIHVSYECVCSDYNAVTVHSLPRIKETFLVPSMLVFITGM